MVRPATQGISILNGESARRSQPIRHAQQLYSNSIKQDETQQIPCALKTAREWRKAEQEREHADTEPNLTSKFFLRHVDTVCWALCSVSQLQSSSR